MKYLKSIFESFTEEEFLQTLKDICLELSDIGCEISVKKSSRERDKQSLRENPKLKLAVAKYDYVIRIRWSADLKQRLNNIIIEIYERIKDYLRSQGFTENIIPTMKGINIEIFKK